MPLALAALTGAASGRLSFGVWPGGAGLTVLLLMGLVLVMLALVPMAMRWRKGTVLLYAVAFVWCAVSIHQQRAGTLDESVAGEDFVLSGTLHDVDVEARRSRFELTIEACEPVSAQAPCPSATRAKLSWYDAPVLASGERWRLTVRLREPLGFANPDTFDYDAWLWREGIQALGYVRKDPAERLSASKGSVRQAALERLDDIALTPRGERWLAALTLGASERLNDADWDLLNATGTTHLVVISGLHVGLVATLALWLLRGISRCLQPNSWRMTIWPWWGAGLAAFAYAALAGLEPPAMRAAIMAGVGLWATSGRHAPGWWQAWWLALALVTIADPLAPWRPGMWLSFTAVGVLIIAWSGRARPRGLKGWALALIRSQWLLSPIMAAAVLVAFGRLSLLAPLVNLIAVPLVGSLLVPLGFAGWVVIAWPALAAWVWWPFERLVAALASGLEFAARQIPLWTPEIWLQWPLALGLILLGALWCLPGQSRQTRVLGSLMAIGLILALRAPSLDEGTLVTTVYDVGQGQLVEIRTREARVLIDTGPRFGSGFTPAAMLWPPGQYFDAVIVTHGDNDHAGGAGAIGQDHRVAQWWAPLAETLDRTSRSCRAGEGWTQGNVTWRFLSPSAEASELSRNDRSCVLLVTLGERHVLVTGDAGMAQEQRFLDALPADGVDVLVAGHHGSATSSSTELIATARPRDVIFSSGRGNAFGHPEPDVVARFVTAGARIWNTAYDGAVRVRLTPAQSILTHQREPGWQWRTAVESGPVGVESRL